MPISIRVQTDAGQRFADLSYRRQERGSEPAWWWARLMLDGQELMALGWCTPGRSEGWTASASVSSDELGGRRSLSMIEGFRTRYDAAVYLIKLHGLQEPRDDHHDHEAGQMPGLATARLGGFDAACAQCGATITRSTWGTWRHVEHYPQMAALLARLEDDSAAPTGGGGDE